MNKTRITIITVCVVLLLGALAAIYFINSNKTSDTSQTTSTALPSRTTAEISAAITKQATELSDNGRPTFIIDNIVKPQEGWYVVTMYLKDDAAKTNPAKILLQDLGGGKGLQVIMGPGTAFPAEETQAYDIPGPVARELNE